MPRRKRAYIVRVEKLAKARAAARAKKEGKNAEEQSDSAHAAPSLLPQLTQGREKETGDNLSSARKRKRLIQTVQEDAPSPSEYIIMKKEDLEAICDHLVCGECYEPKLQCTFFHCHVDTSVKIECSNCKSKPMPGTKINKLSVLHNVREVTLTLVHAIMLLGKGKAAFEKLCSLMNLRNISPSTFSNYSKYVTLKAKKKAKEVLERSRKAVFEFYAKELNRLPDEDGVLDVDVTFGITWQTRGNNSLLGVGDVIDAHSGLILDYETLSKFCVVCSRKENELKRKNISKEQFESWKKEHSSACESNFEGTSLGMKPAAAVNMWSRSLDHNMRYINYISEGDSVAFNAIKQLNGGAGPYGEDHEVIQEKCVHHLSRKLGSELRAISKGNHMRFVNGKKKKMRTLEGCKKLPDGFIAQMQRGLTESVKRAANTSVQEMRTSIMSSLYHYCSTDSKPLHHLCPESSTSWCFYKKFLALGETPPSHTNKEGHFELEPEQMDHVKRVYGELTSDKTISACLRAKTQNPNDSFHSRLWKLCPKDILASRTKLDFAVAQAACNFNAGYVESSLHRLLGIPYTETVHNYLEKQDASMDGFRYT